MKFFTFILFGTFSLLVACSNTNNSKNEISTNEHAQKNYQHYTVGNFETMQSCVDFVASEAKSAGMEIKLSGLSPKKATGSFNGDEAMFFYCQKQEAGTSGTFFEAVYPKFN
ncbi:hypothetical protein ES754_07805 [Psychrobacter frigidicola]|uniref:Lipoprotein n=1 Tax=Psychrobacter frigidicola TaxID=45611 RepID=A0A5C7A2R1_9GAMM|nr:hypothetical protein [Psychrobacter frigidicola]TXD96922.1 hypothetical protein ES754_07805 [Psychrobacter frigidicola]